MTNPVPSRITDPMWQLWRGANEIIPGVRLGGIYANNRGYHNTRNNLLRSYPNSYSIRINMDKKGPGDKAAGLDLTMSAEQMRKRTNYLRRSDMHPDDNRLRAMREFIGTRDSEHVYCRIAGNEGLGQKHGVYDGTRDRSHLWHIHLSILRAFVDDWEMLAPILSVLAGESWEDWLESGGAMPTAEEIAKAVWHHNIPSGHPNNPEWWAETFIRNIESDQDNLVTMTKSILKAHAGDSADDIIAEIQAQGDQTRAALSDKLAELAPVFAQAVADQVDHTLDVAAAAEAIRQVYRELGESP